MACVVNVDYNKIFGDKTHGSIFAIELLISDALNSSHIDETQI